MQPGSDPAFQQAEGNGPVLHIAGMASSDRDGLVLRWRWVTIKRRRLRDHYVVEHDLMHALGFGHTCSWPSVILWSGCDGIGVVESSLFNVADVRLSLNINELKR